MEEEKREYSPFVVLDLDRPRKFRFDFNALITLSEILGIPIDAVGEMLQKKTNDPRLLRAVIYSGLKDDDETLTEKEVGRILTPANMSRAFDRALKHIWDNLPGGSKKNAWRTGTPEAEEEAPSTSSEKQQSQE